MKEYKKYKIKHKLELIVYSNNYQILDCFMINVSIIQCGVSMILIIEWDVCLTLFNLKQRHKLIFQFEVNFS